MGRLAVRFQLSAVSVQMNADRWATTDSGPLFPSCGWVRFEKFLFRRRFIGRRTGLFAFMGPGYAGRFWRCWRCASKLLTKRKKETPDFLYPPRRANARPPGRMKMGGLTGLGICK